MSQGTRKPFSVSSNGNGIPLRDVVELDLANTPNRQSKREEMTKTGVIQFTKTGSWVEKLVLCGSVMSCLKGSLSLRC